MQINSIKLFQPVSFGENTMNNLTPSAAILALQAPGAKIKFENDNKLAHKSDAVQQNPLTAIACKIARTCKYLFNPQNSKTKNNTPKNISFTA